MPHGNPVTDSDCRNHNRGSSRHRHTHFNCLSDLIQIHMPWHNLIVGTDYAHKRSVQFLLRHSQSMKQRTVGRLLASLCYCITSHSFKTSFSTYAITPAVITLIYLNVYIGTDLVTHLTGANLCISFRHNINRAKPVF